MATKQDVNASLLLTVGAVASIIIVVIVIGVQAWYLFLTKEDITAKSLTAVKGELQSVVEEQKVRLHSNIASSSEGSGKISIDRAMDALVKYNGRVPGTAAATQPAE